MTVHYAKEVARSGGKRDGPFSATPLPPAAICLLDHIADGPILDEGDDDHRGRESDADREARGWALPSPLPPIPDRVSQTWLAAVASSSGVHPIVVVGRLQNDGVLNWRSLLAKDAPTVTAFLQSW